MAINRKALQAGRDFEADFEREYGGRLQPNSGATPFYKLDVDQLALLWSLKAAPTAASFRLTAPVVREAIRACEGPAGRGGIPVIGIRFQEVPDLAVFRMADAMALARGEIKVDGGHSKGEIRRARADVSLLDR